jgi:hypothetical protein
VMADISSSVAENAVCWCDGRKKRSRRIGCRVNHSGRAAGVIGGVESGMAIVEFRPTVAGSMAISEMPVYINRPCHFLPYVENLKAAGSRLHQ